MTDNCIFAFESDPKPEDIAVIDEGIEAFNRAHGVSDTYTKLDILLRNDEGQVVGGLLGGTFWGMLTVNILWIAEPYRHHSYGKQMMIAAEQEALKRGCKRAHVQTTDYQARTFYEKLGYKVAGVLEGIPEGHDIYIMHKVLP